MLNFLGNKSIDGAQIVDLVTNQKFALSFQPNLISWSPHKQQIVALAKQSEIQLWTERRPNEWAMAITFKTHQAQVQDVVWAPNDLLLMFASIDVNGNTFIHQKKGEQWEQPVKLEGEHRTIAFQPNSRILVTGGAETRVWQDFKLIQTINMASEAISFNNANIMLAVCGESVSVMQLQEKCRLKQYIQLGRPVDEVRWSVAGSLFMVRCGDEIFEYCENEFNEFVQM